MTRRPRDAAELLPLPPTELHILLTLLDAERHGYAIKQEVEERTSGEVQLGPGTLYGAIKRMLVAGTIAESERRPDPAEDDERRRYYRITPFGRAVAAAEVRRMEQLVELARRKRLLGRLRPA